jgi:hypothetical protein
MLLVYRLARFIMQANWWLVLTAQSFLAPVVASYIKECYITTAIYTFIWLTSMYHHTSYTPFSHFIDKSAIFMVIIHGPFDAWYAGFPGFILMCAAYGYSWFAYVHGSHHSAYCYSQNKLVSTVFHGGLHVLPSLFHVVLLMLYDSGVT